MVQIPLMETAIQPGFAQSLPYQHFRAVEFPYIHPVHWLHSHFAVGGWSPLQRLSGMLTAHMTNIAPQNGFTWHPHRGLEIYTWVLEGELYHEDTTGGKGVIGAGELQRMFAGDFIQHQELNRTDQPTRVIQIWYIADLEHRGLEPHYQQVSQDELPVYQVGDATVYSLIGEDSPMEQHMTGRLTAIHVPEHGETKLELPNEGEDVFFYVTDGEGQATYLNQVDRLGQYDVILARPEADTLTLSGGDKPLNALCFYLPTFLG